MELSGTIKKRFKNFFATNNFSFQEKFSTLYNFFIFQGLIHKVKSSKNL